MIHLPSGGTLELESNPVDGTADVLILSDPCLVCGDRTRACFTMTRADAATIVTTFRDWILSAAEAHR